MLVLCAVFSEVFLIKARFLPKYHATYCSGYKTHWLRKKIEKDGIGITIAWQKLGPGNGKRNNRYNDQVYDIENAFR